MTSVLISGAGIAGPTLAYFLARQGFRPTVVERSQGRRSSGSPVDVRGRAVAVATRMGVTAHLKAAATTAKTFSFVDASGGRSGSLTMTSGEDVELPRGDLARILFEAARDDAEFLFDDTITELSPHGDVKFERAAPRGFDLVIGADGLHSNVRRLAFGPEARFVRHLGVFVATLAVPGLDLDPTDVVMYNSPGKAVGLHPSRGKALAALMYRAPMPDGFHHRDTERHRRLLIDAFDGEGWIVPQILSRVRTADDLYFDSVSRVRMPSWSRGRIALLGDAAAGVSLFGDGSSSAMVGAFTLASTLGSLPIEAALKEYERLHRRVVAPKARRVRLASQLIVPSCRAGITLRNAASRLIGSA
jgi:2-polyprenyl-6-methoxyphenol hydroxylase-like FAD-dependent oxidoreductase